MNQHTPLVAKDAAIAAEYMGVKVPHSPFLNETRSARINAGRYEGQEIAGALSIVTGTDRVLELGAGLGIVGAVIARNVRPASMTAFEANPALIPHIQALYALNGLKSKIRLRNQVLLASPDRPESVEFHVHNSFLGSSLIQNDRRAAKTLSIPTASYETLRTRSKPTVLIMDIEGGELDFLNHANLEGLRAMIVEFHPGAYGVAGMRRCKAVLRNAGFRKIEAHSTRTVWACEREA